MAQSLCVLGRQPALGLAELESLYGASKLRAVGRQSAVLDMPPEEINLQRLGGTVKLCRVLTTLAFSDWPAIEKHLIRTAPDHIRRLPPDGKLQLGLSAYGLNVALKQLQVGGLKIKKVIRGLGRSVRLVPNQQAALSSAQVLHNHLAGPHGLELLAVKNSHQTILAETVAVQDINAYAARDQARPRRDARVGMLPPKLAQIIINLAVNKKTLKSLLDPFCGTGVIMQEALLMGFEAYGADIDIRMVQYASKNVMDWLRTVHAEIEGLSRGVEQADATSATWTTSRFITDGKDDVVDVKQVPLRFSVIASETYLGRPFSAEPRPEILKEVMKDVNAIHDKFLRNVARQTKAGFRMCLAVPAWKTKNGFAHLPVLDRLTDMGYNRVSFVHVRNEDLVYYREGQIVARELVVLTRK